MMAASISASPVGEAASPCINAKLATSALPSAENSQNPGLGRSPPRSTPNIAVDRGSSPMKTIECADVTCCRASAVRSGKPTTTPSATMNRDVRSLREGRFSLNRKRRPSPRIPAMAARAAVRNTGSNCRTATLVAGSDALKITTPMSPLTHPLAVRSMCVSKAVIGADKAVWRRLDKPLACRNS